MDVWMGSLVSGSCDGAVDLDYFERDAPLAGGQENVCFVISEMVGHDGNSHEVKLIYPSGHCIKESLSPKDSVSAFPTTCCPSTLSKWSIPKSRCARNAPKHTYVLLTCYRIVTCC